MKKITLLLLTLLLALTGGHAAQFLFVGTYTDGKPDKGIYVYEFHPASGALTLVSTAQNIVNPSFLSLTRDGKFLYACTETQTPQAGSVTAFAFDNQTRLLTEIGKQPTGGDNPAYITVDSLSRFVITANYTGGSLSVLPLRKDGRPEAVSQLISFSGKSMIQGRQDQSHPHSAVFSPGGAYLFCPDLGTDQIHIFSFDPEKPQPLTSFGQSSLRVRSGEGPRHFVFHPDHRYAYCINELGGSITTYRYHEGFLYSNQRMPAYAEPRDTYSGADIHLSPDGRFLYASNRGENTIAIFYVNASNRQLTLMGHRSTLGDHPRNFTLDPSGNFLLVANQNSHNIVVFRRDPLSGDITPTGTQISVPRPSCLVFGTYEPTP
jgi:6-phosphogluconolactonase (cycloisomerase 2 family)